MTIDRLLTARSIAWLLPVVCIACLQSRVVAWYVPLQGRQRTFCADNRVYQTTTRDEITDNSDDRSLNCGILISSWTDGVLPNPEVQAYLKNGLATSLLSDVQRNAEAAVESSVIQSPCCGPNVEALLEMEAVDKALADVQTNPSMIDDHLENQVSNLKFLYIPTAMYALRADSTNTPGKQRQRARADGKKRRSQIVQTLNDMFDNKINILSVTLDFDDGSVKQPQGSSDSTLFPVDGKAALREWAPHLIYIEGGNTFWLHHCMTKGEWQEDLISAITNNAVYVGKSAGTILAGETVETATWKGWDDPSVVPGMETYEKWKGVKGLELVKGASFFPHMSDEWKELTMEKQREMGEVYCLRDQDVCLVQGSSISVVSSELPVMGQQ